MRGGEISFCEDIDAYDTKATFLKSCEDYIKMLNGGGPRALVLVVLVMRLQAVGLPFVKSWKAFH